MRLLVVDDSVLKRSDIVAVISNTLAASFFSVDQADNLAGAVELASANTYDFIVLDLLLPYVESGPVGLTAGAELLKVLRRGGDRNSGANVIGLSAYPDELKASRSIFEGEGILLIEYDGLGTWRGALRSTIAQARSRQDQRENLSFLVLVALREERDGLEEGGFEFVSDAVVNGLNVRYLRAPNGLHGAVVLLRQIGLVIATLEASIALKTFDTKVFCMTGICAGFAGKVEIGQILVASPVWEYQVGKWSSNGFAIAPNQIRLRARTRVLLDQLCQKPQLTAFLEHGLQRNALRPPRRCEPSIRPFVSGSAVIADESRLKHVTVQHRDIAGLDMEAYALYLASHELAESEMHFFAAKCVVDLADTQKSDDFHQYGCFVSARFLLAFLENLPK